jgi:hypothetical protein
MERHTNIMYFGLVSDEATSRTLRAELAQLATVIELPDDLTVRVERWAQHQHQGTSCRVWLESDAAQREALRADSGFCDSLEQAVSEAFAQARRWPARRHRAEAEAQARLSDEARRLLPLHGWLGEQARPYLGDPDA